MKVNYINIAFLILIMESDLVLRCIEKAKSGIIQKWDEDGKEKLIASYVNDSLKITFANPSNRLIVSYGNHLVLRAKIEKDKEYIFDKYVPGEWENKVY